MDSGANPSVRSAGASDARASQVELKNAAESRENSMALKVRWTKMEATDVAEPVGFVDLFAGDGDDVERSKQWLSARVKLDAPNIKSLALLQIAAVEKARDLLDEEAKRLSNAYRASERVQR
jgi:hypothetical protein